MGIYKHIRQHYHVLQSQGPAEHIVLEVVEEWLGAPRNFLELS